jgi:hypothetical protein
MERIMGQTDTPVRQLVDHAFEEFVRPRADVGFLLTVICNNEMRGFFAGADRSCFEAAAQLSLRENVTLLDAPLRRCVVRLPPGEFHSTWLGNKAIYRTRMAMADGGQLIVVGPGVTRFGEDPKIDALIRKYGYAGTTQVVAAVSSDDELKNNLAAAAHLIHGSTEDRFDVTYCPAPQLSQTEIEEIGYSFDNCDRVASEFQLDAATPGWNEDSSGEPFYFIENPGLGLWSTQQRFERT